MQACGQVSRRRLKNARPKPDWYCSNDGAGFPLPFYAFRVFSTLPERRVCGCSFEAEKKQSTNNLTFNLRCPGSVR
jgi:hypothetical protein